MKKLPKAVLQIAFLTLLVAGVAQYGSVHAQEPSTTSQLVKKDMSGRVSHLHFDGQQVLSVKELEANLPPLLGEVWRPSVESLIIKELDEYAHKKGFFLAEFKIKVVPMPDQSVELMIQVMENQPCLVSKISIEDPPGFKSKNMFIQFKEKMLSLIEIKQGDRFDEDRLADRLRVLKDWLIDKDYILANTEKVSYTFNDNHTSIEIMVNATYGDRVSFGYQGNTSFTKGELNEIISQLRITGLGRDYVGVIQRKFIDEYKAKAFDSIRIDSKVTEKDTLKHVTFIIREGLRSKIASLRWDGFSEVNRQTSEDLFKNSVSRLVQRGYFVDRDIDKGIEVVIEDLKSRGYLFAKLVTKNVQKAVTKNKEYDFYDVAIQLSEGDQTFVGKIDVSGNQYLDLQTVKSMLHNEEGQPFNPFGIEEGLQKIKARYISDGFLDFKFTVNEADVVKYSASTRLAQITVAFSEGQRIKIDEIRLQGLEKTRQYIVEREFVFKQGDYWTANLVTASEDNLRKLGLFSSVRITPIPSGKGPEYRNMLVEMKESDPGSFEAGPGFRSDLGLRAFTRLSYNNIAGKNWIGSIGAQTNRRINDQYRFIEYQLYSGFMEPRFFGSKYSYSVGLSTSKQRFPPDFNATTTQFTTGFERKFFDNLVTAKLYYKLERIRQFDVFINGKYSDVDNATLLIGSLNPTLVYDTRDSPFTTTKGQVSTLSLEYANPVLANQTERSANSVGYTRWVAGTHFYFPLTKDIIWSNVLAGGFERSEIQDRPIPLIKLFRLGGWANIRGYREDSINVDTVSIRGILMFLNLRTQIDFPLVGDLKISPFYDAGNLFIDKLQGDPFLRSGMGAGLRYMTPIGPINLDYGFNMSPRPQDSETQIHFSVGFI